MKTSLLATLALAFFGIGAELNEKQTDRSLLDIQARSRQGSRTQESVKLRPAPHAPGDIVGDKDWQILPRTDIFEVVPSRFPEALVRKLPAHGFVELSEIVAKAYTG